MTRAQLLRHHPTRPRGMVSVALAVVALVAAAVVLALYVVARPARTLDRTTPEGAVQAYLTAVLDGDTAAAAGWFASDSRCDADDLDRAQLPKSTRVELVDVQVVGGTSRVRVGVSVDPGVDPGLGLGGADVEEHVLRLVRSAAGWRLTGVPWPLYACRGGVKA